MEDLRAKWSSRRGESLVLALLFLLVCMMVAASVLMAAASNAGKISGDRQEQQRYLTLSSALRLVCDELNAAQYHGCYTYFYTPPEYDEESNLIQKGQHTYSQTQGEFSCGLNSAADMVLPLSDDLDALFANYFTVSTPLGTDMVRILNPRPVTPAPSHTLTLEVEPDDAEGYPSGLSAQVTVTVKLDASGGPRAGVINVTAELKETDGQGSPITMRAAAELKPSQHPKNVFVLSPPAEGSVDTASLTWTLDWIKKVE